MALTEREIQVRLRSDGVELGPFGLVRSSPPELPHGPYALDALLTLTWEDQSELFGVEIVTAPGRLARAIEVARRIAPPLRPLIAIPYLSSASMERLRESGVSGFDLSGNYRIYVPGVWLVSHTGEKSRFGSDARLKRVYVGTSSLVGRMLLLQPAFERVGDVHSAILARGGDISLGTVSKTLSVMEDDALIEKQGGRVTLKRPGDLLDRLVAGARSRSRPVTKRLRLSFRADDEDVWAEFSAIARSEMWTWATVPRSPTEAGFSFGIGPKPRCYVSVLRPDLLRTLTAEEDDLFANVEFAEAPGPEVFFDAHDHTCSLLQTYLDLMQGGERERQIAAPLRALLLPPVE